MNLPSASSLERAHACPASQVLPHYRSAGSHWASRGEAIHRFLVRVAEVGRDAALEEVESEFREICEAIDVAALPVSTPGAYAFEVGVAWDLASDTARELGRNITREQAYEQVGPTEVVGTMDVVGLAEDSVVVMDYKTGFRHFGPLEENFQLMFYALATARAFKKDSAHLAIIRLDENGRPFFLRGEVGLWELDAFAARLRELDSTIADLKDRYRDGQELFPVTGDHCQFCPAVANCPAWMRLAKAMTSPDANAPQLPDLSAETAPLYIEAVARGKRVLDKIEKGLKLYAEQHPVDLGGGWRYGPHPHPVNEWDVERAWPVLQQHLGADARLAIKAAVQTKAIEAIYRGRKREDKNVRIGKDTEVVLEALKQSGALTVRHTMPIGEWKQKPEIEEAKEDAA